MNVINIYSNYVRTNSIPIPALNCFRRVVIEKKKILVTALCLTRITIRVVYLMVVNPILSFQRKF